MEYVKPRRLVPGDTVAVVSCSWGGPHTFPHVFDAGLEHLTRTFGFRVKEYPTARMSAHDLSRDPRRRAADLEAAFADDEVSAIISSIGGDDSVRILPYLDPSVALANPKVMMGYSDTGTQLMLYNQAGLVTFNGPAVMAGFAQMGEFPQLVHQVRSLLFEPTETYQYQPYDAWVDGYRDWADPAHASAVEEKKPHDGWRWLQGEGTVTGRLFGGCAEVLEMLKGTRYWPAHGFWDDRILFLETSEDKPSPDLVAFWLRNYGVQGVFDQVTAILVGRARDYTDAEKTALDCKLTDIVTGEFGAHDVAIVSNVDLGHTDPQWILPLGCRVEVDADRHTIRLLEPAVR